MTQFWLPGDSDFALAMREPNLLVPWDKNLGNVKPREELQPVSIMLLRPGQETVDLCGLNWSRIGTPVFSMFTAIQVAPPGNQGQVVLPQTRFALTSNTSHYLRTDNPTLRDLPLGSFTLSYVAVSNSGGQPSPAVCGWSGADDIVFYHGRLASSNGAVVFWRDGGSVPTLPSGYEVLYNYTIEHLVVENDGANITRKGYSNGVETYSDTKSASGLGPFSDFYLGCWENQLVISGAISDMMAFKRAFSPADVYAHARDYYGFVLQPANDTPYHISVPPAGGTPTLSSPGAINVLSDRATPQVTLTF